MIQKAKLKATATIAIFTLLFGTALGAEDRPTGNGDSPGAKPISVAITSFIGSFAGLSIYVADRKGLFAAHGIDAQLIPVGSGSASAQALISGSANMALQSIFETLIAVSKGVELKYIVGAETGIFGEIVVRSNLVLPHEAQGYPEVLRDLKGKKIAISSKGSNTYYQLTYALKQAGLDPTQDVTIVTGGTLPSQVAAMKAGQIDGFLSQEPVTTLMQTTGDGRPIFLLYKKPRPPLFDNLMTNGIVATAGYIAANPEAVKRVHDTIAEANRYISSLSTSDTLDLAKAVSPDFKGIDLKVLANGIENYKHLYSPVIETAGVEAANTLLIENGLLKSAVPFDQVVDPIGRTQ